MSLLLVLTLAAGPTPGAAKPALDPVAMQQQLTRLWRMYTDASARYGDTPGEIQTRLERACARGDAFETVVDAQRMWLGLPAGDLSGCVASAYRELGEPRLAAHVLEPQLTWCDEPGADRRALLEAHPELSASCAAAHDVDAAIRRDLSSAPPPPAPSAEPTTAEDRAVVQAVLDLVAGPKKILPPLEYGTTAWIVYRSDRREALLRYYLPGFRGGAYRCRRVDDRWVAELVSDVGF